MGLKESLPTRKAGSQSIHNIGLAYFIICLSSRHSSLWRHDFGVCMQNSLCTCCSDSDDIVASDGDLLICSECLEYENNHTKRNEAKQRFERQIAAINAAIQSQQQSRRDLFGD